MTTVQYNIELGHYSTVQYSPLQYYATTRQCSVSAVYNGLKHNRGDWVVVHYNPTTPVTVAVVDQGVPTVPVT